MGRIRDISQDSQVFIILKKVCLYKKALIINRLYRHKKTEKKKYIRRLPLLLLS